MEKTKYVKNQLFNVALD